MTVSMLRQGFDPASLSGSPGLAGDRPAASASVASHEVWAEVTDAAGFASAAEAWAALAARAAVPNVFMDPAVALAVAEAWSSPPRILLAWRRSAEPVPPRLVGVWMLVEGRSRQSWPYRALVAPVCSTAYLGTPVIDPDDAEPVFAAMLARIRQTPSLPKLLQAGDMSDDPLLMSALKSALTQSAGAWRLIERRTRAKLETTLDAKTYWANSMSAQRRQGFARKRRQLAKQGVLTFSCVDEPDAVSAGLEEFLVLEASGWKAARQSALACDPRMALFTRRMVAGLAARRLVSVQALRIDGHPVAMWVILHSGSGAFTWRTAYDESYGRFSPGVLLLEDTTAHLLSNPAVASADSCNHRDVGYHAERWAERHDVIDLLIDVGQVHSARLSLLSARERLIRRGREAARQAYHAIRQKRAELMGRVRGRQDGWPGAGD